MRSVSAICTIICCLIQLAEISGAQDAGYYLIYGNRDASPIRARLGSSLAITAWGATNPNMNDAITYIHMPLATDDRFIVSRTGGYFPDTLVGEWDDRSFLDPDADSPIDGFTSQSLLAFAYLYDPPDYFNWFDTNGDTLAICHYSMQLTRNSSFSDSVVSPFIEGHDEYNGWTIWGVGIPSYDPLLTYSSLHLIGCENVPGDINNDSLFNALDVVYSVNYLKGFGPGPVCYRECPMFGLVAATADANGSCSYNGMDISYSVNFIKGIGPLPLFCENCPPIE